MSEDVQMMIIASVTPSTRTEFDEVDKFASSGDYERYYKLMGAAINEGNLELAKHLIENRRTYFLHWCKEDDVEVTHDLDLDDMFGFNIILQTFFDEKIRTGSLEAVQMLYGYGGSIKKTIEESDAIDAALAANFTDVLDWLDDKRGEEILAEEAH